VTSGTKIIFDTCAVVKLLDGAYNLAFLGDDIDKALQFISVITRMELLAKPDMLPDEEKDIRLFLSKMPIVPLDEAIEKEAITIRKNTKIKLPDCIIAATSIVLGAVLLTDDPQLVKLPWPGYTVKDIGAADNR
jgi:predicted nucleic acid-binding protein